MSTAAHRHVSALDPDVQRTRLRRLQLRLERIWDATHGTRAWAHSAVIVPSLSFDQDELAKIDGVAFYEERLLFSLIRLRNPEARVLYVTSQPVHQEIVDYYLQLLVGVPAGHARRRLAMFCVYDASPRPLTEKILERPRLVARIQAWIGNRRRAYMTCFNSTVLERELAVRLGIPLNGVDPELLHLGTKSGSRQTFRAAGVTLPRGYENLRSVEDIGRRLADLRAEVPGLRRAVVKLDASFSGEGNANFTYPGDAEMAAVADGDRAALARHLEFANDRSATESYFAKFSELGGIVEELIEAESLASPSVQMRITPGGEVQMISTHDQVLGGDTGQSYRGCRFPADADYRGLIQDEAAKVGAVLARQGVTGRFAIDFVVGQRHGEQVCAAIEINLRMGGTTFPFVALEFLTGGTLDPRTGVFRSKRGAEKFYYATDSLYSPGYRGLLPEDLIDIMIGSGLYFSPSTESGVLFHMIGALSQFGKLGVVSIADSRRQARALFERTRRLLDRATGSRSRRTDIRMNGDGPVVRME